VTLAQAESHIYGLQVVQATKSAQISRLEVRARGGGKG
jgi:hypothetical protein